MTTGGHLVREVLRLGGRLICAIDGTPMDVQGVQDPNKWGHYSELLKEWHVSIVPQEETPNAQ